MNKNKVKLQWTFLFFVLSLEQKWWFKHTQTKKTMTCHCFLKMFLFWAFWLTLIKKGKKQRVFTDAWKKQHFLKRKMFEKVALLFKFFFSSLDAASIKWAVVRSFQLKCFCFVLLVVWVFVAFFALIFFSSFFAYSHEQKRVCYISVSFCHGSIYRQSTTS